MLIRDRRYDASWEVFHEVFSQKDEVLKSPSDNCERFSKCRKARLFMSIRTFSKSHCHHKLTSVLTAYEMYISLLPSCSLAGCLTCTSIHFPFQADPSAS